MHRRFATRYTFPWNIQGDRPKADRLRAPAPTSWGFEMGRDPIHPRGWSRVPDNQIPQRFRQDHPHYRNQRSNRKRLFALFRISKQIRGIVPLSGSGRQGIQPVPKNSSVKIGTGRQAVRRATRAIPRAPWIPNTATETAQGNPGIQWR